MLRRRRAWIESQPHLEPEKLVFVDELWESIGEDTDNFSPAECQNYFVAAGHERV